jgi:TonB-linked SusC/RagA family outer membrane protein
MKKRLSILILIVLNLSVTWAQQRTIKGKISDEKGVSILGASVIIKGSTIGNVSDSDGNYALDIPSNQTVLVVSFVGYLTQEITVGASNVLDVVLADDAKALEEVVVTALGISRNKNELPYSAQKLDGSDVRNTRDNNVINSLSGKIAGLNIKRNNSLGGSTNIVLRGTKSLTGNNQALFIVDGVPIDNANTNSNLQKEGGGGYDYGSAAADINSDDIESITVLKGAAATALYGSRASNGVILMTTKSKSRGLGITVNMGVNMGNYDKSTFPKYQDKYGQGYGPYYEDASGFFLERDVNGDGTPDLVTPLSEDASWGSKFDASKQVYQWDAFDPSSPNFGKPRPWVAAANGPATIFEQSVGTNNGIMIDGGNEKAFYKVGFTHSTDKGIMPNSRINKDMVNFGGSYSLTDNLKVFSALNYTATTGLGRYGSGYESRNLMTNFRQWWPVNVDVQEQKAAYERNKTNATWNWADPSSLVPRYWDNPYWTRYENYQNDNRNRYFGHLGMTYGITPWLDLTGRVSLDQYDEKQEERFAVSSIGVSQYSRYNRNFQEINYDFLAQIKPISVLNDHLSVDFLLGSNNRKTATSSIYATTNGGIGVPRAYSLGNSKNPLEAPTELEDALEVNGIFTKLGLVFNKWAVLDLTMRRDQASSLPKANNTYYYPSASLGLIFSNLIGVNKVIDFGKVRLNYAEVGNTAPPLSIFDTYNFKTPFGDAGVASISNTKNNSDLKPERTKSTEIGLEMRFLNGLLGFDATWYKLNTIDQILPATISRATGYAFKYINAGNVENTGVEISMFIRPIHTSNFDWKIDLNWARNRNIVLDLGGIDNLQLAGFQGGISINAALNEPYGTIRGKNFVYHANGQKIVDAGGHYQQSVTSNEIIGNINPDWTGGISNTFKYKNLTFSFLIDAKQGGQLFSLDLSYGLETGIYEETAGLNELGKEIRSEAADQGGIILPGVTEDGVANTKRVGGADFGLYGYEVNPAAAFIYDASFVKLREMNLSYNIPTKGLFKNVIKGLQLGLYGRNIWIISKNLPHADPEDGVSSGNIQGHQGGVYPITKVFGANLKIIF